RTSSSISPGASCLADCANGPTSSDQWDSVLMPERGLQRLQAIKLLGELVAVPAVLLVGYVFLGVLDHAGERRDIELVHRHSEVGDHGQAFRPAPGEPAVDHDPLRVAFAINDQNSRPQRGYERSMSRQHAEVAFRARHVDLTDLAGEQDLLRRDEIE